MESSERPRRTRPKQIHVGLSHREYERLRRAADDQHRSVSSMIRYIVWERLGGKVVAGRTASWERTE